MKSLDHVTIPKWLREIQPDSPFSVQDVLADSLYYPAAGTDGKPVQFLVGFVHSFVYVDYSIPKEKTEDEIANPGFRGYKPILRRELQERELVPNGWVPMQPNPQDGDPRTYRESMKEPYALWAVFERNSELGEDHGPKRFSLLYICGDGVATFQALYGGNNVSPKVLAIIQPGHAFGLNWTNFTKPDGFMARSVRAFSKNPPAFMLYGGYNRGYSPCCWPEYSEFIERWLTARTEVGLWKLGKTGRLPRVPPS